MTFIDAVILGVVEGITEFLPISSTGHLILTGKLLGLASSEFLTSFEIAIQLGAILAVVILYWRKLLVDRGLVARVLAAFVPTAVIGLAFHGLVKTYLLGNAQVVLINLFVGGIVLILFEYWYGKKAEVEVRVEHADSSPIITYKQAIIVGLAQALAIIPGVSRAATTVFGGLALGLPRKTIVEFSFLLAIPTMAAATVLDLSKTGSSFSGQEWQMLLVGFFVSLIVAWLAIKWLLIYISHHNFTAFGWYRILAAVLAWWIIF